MNKDILLGYQLGNHDSFCKLFMMIRKEGIENVNKVLDDIANEHITRTPDKNLQNPHMVWYLNGTKK